MVNLDIEGDTSDLRINQHKESGNLLGEEYEEDEEIISLEDLCHLFEVIEQEDDLYYQNFEVIEGDEIHNFHHLYSLLDEGSEENEAGCEGNEQGIEDGEASGCFKWGEMRLISEEHEEMINLLDMKGEKYEEGSQEREGSKEVSEEGEEMKEGSEDDEQLPLSANEMLCNLTLEIDLTKENTDQLQSKYEEKTIAFRRILEKRIETQHTFFEEARDQSKRVLEQQEMLDFDFENKRQRLNSWSEELNKRDAALTEEKIKMDDHYLAKERQRNDELLEAAKELMKGLEDMPSHCRVKIGIKRRGCEINEKAFMSACKKKYLPHEAVELCSFLEEKMRDLKGIAQEVLNEKDKLVGGLKDDDAVVAALENNTSGNGMDTELWNFEEDRKASHCEVIRYIFSRWKTLQCKRDEIDEVIKTLF